MPAVTTVLYPKGTNFNMDYYMKTHMPLVANKWGPEGLTGWKVLKFGDDAPYCVQATIEWSSMEAFQKASQSTATKEIMEDVPNFADKKPELCTGDVVGSS